MEYLKKLEPQYLKSELLQPKEILWRFDNTQSRYYFRFPEGGDEIAYLGATGAVDALLPKGTGLFDWYARNGALAKLQLEVLSSYGTMLHSEIASFERAGRRVNFGEVEGVAARTANVLGFGFTAEDWAYHLPRNLAAWIQFTIDNKVEVLAVEYPVWSDKYSIATLVDIYCEMTFSKKRVKAIINIKKGATDGHEDENKVFYDAHDLQLQIEKTLWLESSGLPLDMVFNWSPNNWVNEPSYTLKNWTDKTKYPADVLADMLPIIKRVRGYFSPPRKSVVLKGEYVGGDSLTPNIEAVRIKP